MKFKNEKVFWANNCFKHELWWNLHWHIQNKIWIHLKYRRWLIIEGLLEDSLNCNTFVLTIHLKSEEQPAWVTNSLLNLENTVDTNFRVFKQIKT